ncbi:MAG: 30S ribosomal protein S6 [Planctomycetaceae bacterium]
MAENLYEGMFLVESGRFASNPERVTQTIIDILEKSECDIVAHRPWQDGKLAYPVEGMRKGLHFLTYFRMPGEDMDGLLRSCRLSDLIIRNLVLKHPPKLFDAMVQAINPDAVTTADTPVGDAAETATSDDTETATSDDTETANDGADGEQPDQEAAGEETAAAATD